MLVVGIAVLAALGQIHAFECKPRSQVVVPRCGRLCTPADSFRYGELPTGSVMSRDVYAREKYPVVLKTHRSENRIPVVTSHLQAPVQERPPVHLPAKIPPPRTISHSCTCYKTVLRPHVEDHIITIPSIQQFIETTHSPVVESIHYETSQKPRRNVNSEIVFGALDGPPPSAASPGIQLSRVSGFEFPQMRSVRFPRASTLRSLGLPQLRVIEIPQLESFRVPTAQTFKSNCFSI
ncbi:hypothetical protein RUM44_007042 [Polyplax serrata]|uniref:Uncharacterized protein n=1 Tax=Polyplax serrata TaxID=468196 RepID=A0ABR1B0C4_POLSC